MAGNFEILDEKFEQVGQASVDTKNRVVLKKALDMLRRQFGEEVRSGIRFVVAYNRAGQILLSPETAVPMHEAWLWRNKQALTSVHRGLDEARKGKLKKAPKDFAKYAKDEID
jgi:hypothetical protein